MAEQEKQIVTDLADHIARLSEDDKKLIYGVALGLDLARTQPEE